MSTIWHEAHGPSFFGLPPVYSFYEQAEVVSVAPWAYEVAHLKMMQIEAEMGREFYRKIARDAYLRWQTDRAWYCYF